LLFSCSFFFSCLLLLLSPDVVVAGCCAGRPPKVVADRAQFIKSQLNFHLPFVPTCSTALDWPLAIGQWPFAVWSLGVRSHCCRA